MIDPQFRRPYRGQQRTMILVVVFVVVSIAVGATLIARTVRTRTTPRELRGDWWSRFESEFRDYARRTASAGSGDRRRQDTPPR
jgi:hypothetical protein